MVLKRGEGKALARAFADYFTQPAVRDIMSRYGFSAPGDAATR